MRNTNRLGLAFCLGALLAFTVSACATLPATTPNERVAQDAAACLQTGPCFVLLVDNGGDYEATIRVNGFYVGRVTGNRAATIFVHESLLVDGRCAQISAFFRDLARSAPSTKECIRLGGRFAFSVDPLYHAWLVPRGGS